MTSKVGGNSDSRRQTGRDSEIAPTNMKSCKKQQNYHVTSTSRYFKRCLFHAEHVVSVKCQRIETQNYRDFAGITSFSITAFRIRYRNGLFALMPIHFFVAASIAT